MGAMKTSGLHKRAEITIYKISFITIKERKGDPTSQEGSASQIFSK